MGRAEDRKKSKQVKKRLTNDQFLRLQSDINREFINMEVEKAIGVYQKLWTDCMMEAFKRCGYSLNKVKVILDEIELIMHQKVEEKRNGKS